MPIYEFYCGPCNTVFSFLSRRPGVSTLPVCPSCGAGLSREVSPFACLRGGKDAEGADRADDPLAGLDEARMEKAMEALSGEMGTLEDEDADPRDSARLFKKFAEVTGMRFNPAVREALARMEAGADPDQVEAEFGEVLNADNPFEDEAAGSLRDLLRRMRNEPRRDPKLYDLP